MLRPVRRALRRLVAGIARLLPPARGQALVAGSKAVFTLVTGHPTSVAPGRRPGIPGGARKPGSTGRAKGGRSGGSSRAGTAGEEAPLGGKGDSAARANAAERLPRAAQEELARAESALERGRFSETAQRTEWLARMYPTTLKVMQLRATALGGIGDVAERAAVLHRLHLLRDDLAIRREERAVVGRLVETSPGWLPHIPGPAEPLREASAEVVLYLVGESAPYRSTPGAERLAAYLRAAVRAGLQPEVATALGFPRSIGVTAFAATEIVEGIPHHRLDLGPSYSLDRPPDRRLRDAAWLTAALARRIRPAVIHAIPGEDGLEPALVGAALREHLGVALVYEAHATASRAGSDEANRRAAAAAHLMQLADHVIASDAAMRDAVVGGAVAPERVSVIDGAESEAGDGSRLRDVYRDVLAARASAGGA